MEKWAILLQQIHAVIVKGESINCELFFHLRRAHIFKSTNIGGAKKLYCYF